MQKSGVFEQTYQHYLARIGAIDYLARADLLGAESDGEALIIPFYDRLYSVSAHAIEGLDGAPAGDAVRVILGRYVLSCPDELPTQSNTWVTYREFADAAPLVSYFTSNTNKKIEAHFSSRAELLEKRCSQLGASLEENPAYAVSAGFLALPRIPVVLNFNDADELFPAVCSILYRQSAHYFLDMECLAMTGTLLAGKLLAA